VAFALKSGAGKAAEKNESYCLFVIKQENKQSKNARFYKDNEKGMKSLNKKSGYTSVLFR